jgi:prepilin-type processing-associated H-X9-DG protein
MSDEFTDPLKDPKHARVVARLALDREPPVAPAGLAMRTVARLAEVLVAERVHTADTVIIPSTVARTIASSDSPVYLGRRRADLIVAAAVGFLVIGLSLTGLQKLRADASIRYCQNTLRGIHDSLTQYADVHQGRYPTIGGSAGPNAGDFASELARSGHLPSDLLPVCPGDQEGAARQVGYTYTLGSRSPSGAIIGFRRPDPLNGDTDSMPLLADFPASAVAPMGGPTSPHGRGQNVLYAGGHVRYTTSAAVGPDGDDIYRNARGQVRAGLSWNDVCLGGPNDRP